MHVEYAIKSIMMPLDMLTENLQKSLDILKIDIKCYAHLLKYFLFSTFENQYYYYFDNFWDSEFHILAFSLLPSSPFLFFNTPGKDV